MTNKNGGLEKTPGDLAILTRKSRLKPFRLKDMVSLKAGLVVLSIYLVYGVVYVFYPAVLELIEQVVLLTILPLCLYVFLLIGRAFYLIYLQLRK